MSRLWVLGEFSSPDAMVAALSTMREAGHPLVESFTPYPVRGVPEALRLPRPKVPLITLCGALVGASGAYLMQWWMNAVDFRINVGGRPPHSPPSFIPITFELAVLIGSLSAFFGMWALLGLPRPHHPVFELERFRSAAIDRFWVGVVETDVERAEAAGTRLRELGADYVGAVEEAVK